MKVFKLVLLAGFAALPFAAAAQAAEREISTAAETLNNEEESLIKGLGDIEVAERCGLPVQ